MGTSGCKASVVDASGSLVAEARRAHASRYPRAGWVEQSPSDWLAAVHESVDAALGALPAERRPLVRAIGVSAPTHVAVLLDEDGDVLRPAIMWNDQRSGAWARRLEEEAGALIVALTANSPSPTWTLPQLAWIAENEPRSVRRVARVVFMKDWVRNALCTTRAGTDRIDAQGSLLFDVVARRWSAELAGLAGLPATVLPEVDEPTDIVGVLRPEYAARWGLLGETPLVMGTTDTAAEILAAGAVREGDVVIKLATAGNVARVARGRPENPRVLCYEHVVPGLSYWNSATSSAAAALAWFVESLAMEGSPDYPRIDEAVSGVVPGAGGVLFTPFLHGERAPRYDEGLRAGFIGLTAAHSWREAARAVMEGVAYSLRDAAVIHGALPDRARLVGGGARSAVWPQIVADVLDLELSVPPHADSSVGAALVAGVGVGVVDSYDDVADRVGAAQRVVVPDAERSRFYARRFDDYREFAAATTALSHRLGNDPWSPPAD